MHSTLWEFSLHLLHIFRIDWNFLTEFGNFDPKFNRSILTLLYLKFETFAYSQIAVNHYYILFTSFLTCTNWGYNFINEVGQWFYQLDQVTFSKNVHLYQEVANIVISSRKSHVTISMTSFLTLFIKRYP